MKFQKSTRATKSFDKPEFLSYSYGQHRVRFLGEPKLKYIHFFYGRGSIECLGDECPVCARNREIRAGNPDDYRDHPKYVSWSERHYVNALDRTDVIICPECGNEMKADYKGRYPSKCTECDVFVGETTPAPLDKVRIINLSKTNKEILELIDASILDKESGDRIGVENMDIIFMVTKSGSRKNISIKEDSSATDKVEVPEDALFDLDTVTIKLSLEETEEFMNGVSLRDIFASRNATEEKSNFLTDKVTEKEETSVEDAKKKVDDLFKTLDN